VRGPTISRVLSHILYGPCVTVWLMRSAASSMKAMLFMKVMENIIETPRLNQINIDVELRKI